VRSGTGRLRQEASLLLGLANRFQLRRTLVDFRLRFGVVRVGGITFGRRFRGIGDGARGGNRARRGGCGSDRGAAVAAGSNRNVSGFLGRAGRRGGGMGGFEARRGGEKQRDKGGQPRSSRSLHNAPPPLPGRLTVAAALPAVKTTERIPCRRI